MESSMRWHLSVPRKIFALHLQESGSAGLAAKRFHNVDKDEKADLFGISVSAGKDGSGKDWHHDKIGKTFGPVSANVTAAMALGSFQAGEKDILGLGLACRNAAFKSRKAYVAARCSTECV